METRTEKKWVIGCPPKVVNCKRRQKEEWKGCDLKLTVVQELMGSDFEAK